uniref:Uncharacterized protein n=1 Tax=Rhizophora mucronata TaxID=61149 RepID=A0A2P2PYJ1_RHIMU
MRLDLTTLLSVSARYQLHGSTISIAEIYPGCILFLFIQFLMCLQQLLLV